MSVDFSVLFGNAHIKNALSQKLSSGRLSHAYLIAGKKGSGKKTLAFLLSAAIACEKKDADVPCMTCPACRKVLSGQSPDLITLGVETLPLMPRDIAARDEDVAPDKPEEAPRSIGVRVIRDLQHDVYVMPNELDKKIYIIDRAERMTEEAQNALLKILEEPPSSVLYLLLCEDPSQLLATVRSRVQTLQMQTFDDGELLDYITKTDSVARSLLARDPDKLALYTRLSGGCIGTLRQYLASGTAALRADPTYEAYQTAMTALSVVFAKAHKNSSSVLGGEGIEPRKTALYDLFLTRAATRDKMKTLMDALFGAVRDLLYASYTEDEETYQPLYFANAAQPMALAREISPEDVMGVADALTAMKGSLEYNPNASLLAVQLADTMMRLRFR